MVSVHARISPTPLPAHPSNLQLIAPATSTQVVAATNPGAGDRGGVVSGTHLKVVSAAVVKESATDRGRGPALLLVFFLFKMCTSHRPYSPFSWGGKNSQVVTKARPDEKPAIVHARDGW